MKGRETRETSRTRVELDRTENLNLTSAHHHLEFLQVFALPLSLLFERLTRPHQPSLDTSLPLATPSGAKELFWQSVVGFSRLGTCAARHGTTGARRADNRDRLVSGKRMIRFCRSVLTSRRADPPVARDSVSDSVVRSR